MQAPTYSVLNMITLPLSFTLSIMIFHTSASIVSDFCVADLSLPHGPAGYSCKDPKRVTVDDFVYPGLTVSNNTRNPFKSTFNLINTSKLPGLNGLGISVGLRVLDVGGFSPFHTHRVSEVLIVVEGTIVAGFIDDNNKAYYKTLNQGDLIIFPPTLVHFYFNAGSTRVFTYAAFASENPGTQDIDNALFGGNLPSHYVQKIGLFDDAQQVQKLKKLFGGTN